MSKRLFAAVVVVFATEPARAATFAFTPDGRAIVAVSQSGTLRIHAPPDVEEPTVIRAHKGAIHAVTVSPDGRRVVTVGADGVARVWDRRTWKEVVTLRGHTGDVYAVAVSPDGTLVATGAADRTARLWDAATGKERAKLEGHAGGVLGVCFAADGRSLFTGATEPDDSVRGVTGPHRGVPVRRWDVATGKPADFPAVRGFSLAVSRRGLAIGDEGMASGPMGFGGRYSVALVTPAGKERATVPKCGTGVAFSPDGLFLAVSWATTPSLGGHIIGPGSQTRGLAVIDALDGTELFSHAEDTSEAAFSPDGRRLAVFGRGRGPGFQLIDLAPAVGKEFAADPEAAWKALADGEAKLAHEALWALVRHGPKAVALIGERLKPVVAPSEDELRRHVAGLNSARFADREAAARRLRELGPAAAPALRAAVKAPPSEEARERADQLLALAEGEGPPDPEVRQRARAVGVLERINSPESRAVLARLAGGTPGAWLTDDADSALNRAKLWAEK
jgi:WD domain, G-beta repeat/WD40-like Beta Propeller Repeat